MSRKIQIQTAKVFAPLLEPARYKGAWGGRGSGKSQFFGGLMIEEHLIHRGRMSVCIREVQKSLDKSSKKLLENKIAEYGLTEADGFKIYHDVIKTPGDGLIVFQGMQDHTADSIKSLEGFDIAWVEEAQSLSAFSLMLLRPTLRKETSELWFGWNPRRKTDPVDALLRGSGIPTGAKVVAANYRDNPWFPRVLEQERLDDLRNNPDQYDHIWEGGYSVVTVGAYYAKSIMEMRNQGRLCRVVADPLMTIRAVWDIGGTGAKADSCAIWICQYIGREIRVLDHYEAQGQPLAAHVNWLRSNGYGNALCVLPHDGSSNDKVYDVSYESALRSAGFEVIVVPNQGKGAAMMRIEATRRLFPSIWMDEQKTKDGLEALGAYHAKIDDKRGADLGPNHDWSSHSSDAFGLMCISYEEPRVKKEKRRLPSGNSGWQGA